MAVYPERREAKAAIWSRRFASFAAILLLLGAVCHRYGLLDTVPFFWVLGIVGALVIGSVASASLGLYRLWTFGERAGRNSTRGLLLALIVATPFLVSGYRVFAYPRLHEISTDLVNPPDMPIAARLRTPDMNAIGPISADAAALQRAGYRGLTGRRYSIPADGVLQTALVLIERRGWLVRVAIEPGDAVVDATIEAAAGSAILALPVDVALRIEATGGTTIVDMRSSSRYGLHDFGDNAARITSFLRDLDAAVAAIALPPAEEEPEEDEGPSGIDSL